MLKQAPISQETVGDVSELIPEINLRLGELADQLHASRISITVPRDNTDSGQPTELTIQEVLLPLLGGSAPSSSATVIDAEAVLGGATWTDLTDGGETILHHHDARYVNVTGDAMTGSLAMGNNSLTGVGLLDMQAADDKIQWAATRYLTGENALELHDNSGIWFYSPTSMFIGTALNANMNIELRRDAGGADSYLSVVGVSDYLIPGSLAGDLVLSTSQSGRSVYLLASTTGAFEVNQAGVVVGNGGAGIDYTVTFNGADATGVYAWMEDEDRFQFSDDILIGAAEKLMFRQTTNYINSAAADYLDYVAVTAHRFDTLIDLVATTATAGQITQAGTRLLHTYGPDSLFAGTGAGNFTQSGALRNTGLGKGALDALTDADDNVGVGVDAAGAVTTAGLITAIGNYAVDAVSGGSGRMTGVGYNALGSATASYDTAVGVAAGFVSGGLGVFLGYAAGLYETGANKLFIDNATRTNEADGRVKALVYGIFAAATADQYLTINGHLYAREDSLMIGTAKWQFRDPEINISSKADSYLDIEADGCVRINTNAWFEADGTHVASGAATTFDDIYMAFEGAHVPASNNPTWTAWLGNVSAYVFAVNDYLDLEATELIHTYLEGSNFEFHVHWCTDGVEGAAKYVKWEIEYSIANSATSGAVGDTFPATTVVSAETEIPASTPDRQNMYTTVATITGTNFKMGAIMKMRIRRIASAGTAPLANPFGFMVGIHAEQDTDGSRTQRTK